MHIVSTMGSGELGRELDLSAVVDALSENFDTEASFHSDSMVTIRLEEDGPALTLYRTGTFQIRGTETREDLFRSKEKFLEALQQIGLELDDVDFHQNNAVFLEDFNSDIHLEALAIHLGLEDVEYEPEQFPGVIYRPPDMGTVMLVFNSGKAIISGTISEDVAQQSSDHLRDEIQSLS
jgi:transcription initiation factor TFIID TATA-box-binding protein